MESTTDTEQLADSIKEHVLNMLKMSNEITRLEEKHNDLQNELKSITNLKTGLIKEYKDAKKLLDHCLENRQDPIQTKLSYTMDELKAIPFFSTTYGTGYALPSATFFTTINESYIQPFVSFGSGKRGGV
jgi:chromosome segregation ATPase